jgi:phage gp29-like protein
VTGLEGEIKELAFGAKGEMPFPALVDYMDRTIAILWRGGDLSTNSAGAGDVGANAQGEEKDEIAEADALMISEVLNEQLERPALRYLFGTEEPLAYLRIRNKTRPDVAMERATDQFLINAGVPVAIDDLAERYNRPIADAGKVIARPASSAAPGQPFANESRSRTDEAFRRTSVAAVAKARADALSKLNIRLRQISAMDDETQQRAALQRLKASLPELLGDASRDPALITAIEEAMAAAVVSGAAEAAQKRTSVS